MPGRQRTRRSIGESTFKITVSLLPANYKHGPVGPPSFTQGRPPPLPHPYQITPCKVILAKISLSSRPSPWAEQALSPTGLTAFHQLFRYHIHAQPLLLPHLPLPLQAWSTPLAPPPTSPAPSLTSCPTVDITFVLTGLLSELPREKGKRCPLPGRDQGDSKQQQLESQGISLDHHLIDILTLIFT